MNKKTIERVCLVSKQIENLSDCISQYERFEPHSIEIVIENAKYLIEEKSVKNNIIKLLEEEKHKLEKELEEL